jgi:high-affinity nickel-transport protein
MLFLIATLLTANAAAWAWALLAFHTTPMLLGTAALAYGLGLRHAVDADHIAAIDNVTRKLRGDGERPLMTGLFFSLGHSTVVVLASIGIVLSAGTFRAHFAALQAWGGTAGTLISAAFLFVIAAVNAVILADTVRRVRRTPPGIDLPVAGGPLTFLVRPAFRLIHASWQMYPLGFLFGLGFDTASEVGLLGLSAAEAAKGMALWSILVLPALFTAGMSLVDTADGVLMLHAYNWAFDRPRRKLYYNLAITAASVAIAVGVGGIELLGLVADRFGWSGGIIGAVSAHFGLIGYGIIALLAAMWLGSVAIARVRGKHVLF